MTADQGIGRAVRRYEDAAFITGRGRYLDDIAMPGMLHGVVLRSVHAHARIAPIDAEAARAAPGVRLVLTGEDWERHGLGDLPGPSGPRRADGSPMYRPAYSGLARERVRWVGDCLAFVVADSVRAAQDAAEMIEVDYEVLPAVVDPAAAVRDGAPLVWDDCPGNVCFVHEGGDRDAADAAFATAAHVVEQEFRLSRVTAAALEPRGCIGAFGAGRYTLHIPVQRPYGFRAELARTLGVPESSVRVVVPDVGGSFGMKNAVYNEAVLVLLAARLAGAPVKWLATRSESFQADAHGRDNLTRAALALDADGRFLGLRVSTVANLGAYIQTGSQSTPVANLGTLAGVYTTPAIHVQVTAAFTHTAPLRPYRGNGRPEAAYVIERLVDIAADETGIDPAELRRRNIIPADAMPYRTGLTFTYDCGEFEKNMDMALELADYAGFEARRREARRRGRLRGIGISNTIERAAIPGYESAEIRFDRSGTATILCGAVQQGQGHETVLKQVAGDRLGLDPGDMRYVSGDTDAVTFGEGTGSSRTAVIAGTAMALAAERILDKARPIAAHLIGADASGLDFRDGVFAAKGSNRTVTLAEVARAAAEPSRLPPGAEPGLAAGAVYDNRTDTFPNGCHVCELEVDEETGEVEVVAYSIVDDVGVALNPMIVEGQIHGGVAQGAGQVLAEAIRYEADTGQLLTGSFMDYAMPRAADLCGFRMRSNPVPTATNPLGAKGAGEMGCVGALPAVANALADALSPLGIRHVEMPITAERLWQCIAEAKG